MRRLLIPAYLIALMAYTLLGAPSVPFHGDESTLIFTTRDYFDQFVRRDLSTEDPMVERLRLLDGRVQKYLGGFAHHLTGGSAESLNTPWLWGADYTYNRDNGHIPDERLLTTQRIAIALLLALSVPAAYGVGAQVGGLWGGALMAALIAFSPNLLINGRRAMMEAPLLLFSLLSVLAGLRWIAAERRRWLWLIPLGIGAGMALASKHSAVLTLGPLFAGLGLAVTLQGRQRRLISLAAGGVIALAVFFAFNPAWWSDPLGTFDEVMRLRSDLLAEQVVAFGDYGDFGLQVNGYVTYGLLDQPQYFEVAEWGTWPQIVEQIAAYESSPWSPPAWFNAVRAVLTLGLALVGVFALIRRRDGISVTVGVWAAGAMLAALMITPLAWARYYLPALPPLFALAAAGIGLLARRRTLT
ncbi:MAG: phospholipid carrier-dependent glycosyltransferase [Chloroflexi bacterium]|nr:phospholipid carrier-dependent glycosyltransferase [Chloroflexota bacterium]